MAKRSESDEYYVIDLCDEILCEKAERQHRFDFLRGDGNPGRKLPVDAFYSEHNLVVEYRERQHTESVPHFDKRQTISGVTRGEQRRIYDQRRRDVLKKHGIKLIEISCFDLEHKGRGRLLRNRESDLNTIKAILNNSAVVIRENKKVILTEQNEPNLKQNSTQKRRNWRNRDGAYWDGLPFKESKSWDRFRRLEEWGHYMGYPDDIDLRKEEEELMKPPKFRLNWLEKCIIYPTIIIILMYIFGRLLG